MLICVLVFWSELYESFYDDELCGRLLITNRFAYQESESMRQRVEALGAELELSA